MKKEVILQSNPLRAERYANVNISLFAAFKAYLLRSAVLLFLSQLYSRLLEMRITPLQAFHLTHAQVVFYLMIFPCNFPLVVRVLLMLWFFLTVLQCRHAGLK